MKILAVAWECYVISHMPPAEPDHARSVSYARMGPMRVLATEFTSEPLKEIDAEFMEWCRGEEQKQKLH
jgi:hypothetical protein